MCPNNQQKSRALGLLLGSLCLFCIWHSFCLQNFLGTAPTARGSYMAFGKFLLCRCPSRQRAPTYKKSQGPLLACRQCPLPAAGRTIPCLSGAASLMGQRFPCPGGRCATECLPGAPTGIRGRKIFYLQAGAGLKLAAQAGKRHVKNLSALRKLKRARSFSWTEHDFAIYYSSSLCMQMSGSLSVRHAVFIHKIRI